MSLEFAFSPFNMRKIRKDPSSGNRVLHLLVGKQGRLYRKTGKHFRKPGRHSGNRVGFSGDRQYFRTLKEGKIANSKNMAYLRICPRVDNSQKQRNQKFKLIFPLRSLST